MSREKQSNRIYLGISFGRVREKCRPDHPEAVERTTKGGDKTYAIEWKNVGGVLESVAMRDDQKYGRQWVLNLNDSKENYALQFSENSRFCTELLKRLPNMTQGAIYKFTPYDFEKDGDRKVGLKIEDSRGNRVENYYERYTDLGEGKWKVEQFHGFPKYEGDWKNKTETKIYFMRVADFLSRAALDYIKSGRFGEAKPEAIIEPEPEPGPPIDEKADDLPF